MEDLSLHILDIAENAIRASAKRIEIKVEEEIKDNLLIISIKDDGVGMNEETIKKALDPFFTTKATGRVGLGLSLLAQSVKEANGNLEIKSKVGGGTEILATFQYDHIDRKPLGDLLGTVATLTNGYPEVDFLYEYKKDGDMIYYFDTKKLGLKNAKSSRNEV